MSTVTCGCGFTSAEIACLAARSEVADLHAKVCDFTPMLPYCCEVCGDRPEFCPNLSHVLPFLRTEAVLAAGCWKLQPTTNPRPRSEGAARARRMAPSSGTTAQDS
ncbi:hypothetical protein ACWIGW_44760 [Nocardia brasiliensis]|uniref:hypothetical protein n=1 Tax=Streptomyces sp. NPDC056056 TaxID=3345698 RepID=UPI0035DA16AD